MDSDYSKRLLRMQNGQSSPPTSKAAPKTPQKDDGGDRFIPTRTESSWHLDFSTPRKLNPQSPSSNKKPDEKSPSPKKNLAYSCLLKNELLGDDIEGIGDLEYDDLGILTPRKSKKMFQYRLSRSNKKRSDASPYSMTPVGDKSQKLLRTPKKAVRQINSAPYKVLDAPDLQDDFYLNLVDWSSQNVICIGLGTTVYLWTASTGKVNRLCELSEDGDSATSVSWTEKGHHVAVGTQKGIVQLWDVAAQKKVATLQGHSGRIGALAWNGSVLASGSRDRFVLTRDLREPPTVLPRMFKEHRQEVCGLKWSPDGQHLASGGNDNKLCIWNMNSSQTPMQVFTQHTAAVKAISWSPHQHGLLASGGGTSDRCIRFWNTLTGQSLHSKDTGSQVCSLAWSKHSKELVSTHGYSQNEILVWKYPTMDKIAKLTGHTYRVIYMCMSPDGESIATGAGDETLRFWDIFSKTKPTKQSRSALNLFSKIR